MTTPKYLKEQTYPYSCGTAYDELGERVIEALFDELPHGSGLNGRWDIDQMKTKRDKFTLTITYDAMDEVGGYCHYYPIKLTVSVALVDGVYQVRIDKLNKIPERACCGYGLNDYIYDTLDYPISLIRIANP